MVVGDRAAVAVAAIDHGQAHVMTAPRCAIARQPVYPRAPCRRGAGAPSVGKEKPFGAA